MNLFIEKNPLSFQCLSVPPDIYNKYNPHSFVIVDISKHYKVLCLLRLNSDVLLKDVCFIDKSVIIPERTFCFESLKVNHAVFYPDNLQPVVLKEAQKIDIDVVCNDPSAVLKCKNNKDACTKLLKKFLLMFKIVKGCFVLCHSLPRLKCHAVYVRNIDGKDGDAYYVSDKSQITINSILSLEMHRTLEGANSFDTLFMGEETEVLPRMSRITEETIFPPNINNASITIERNLLLVGPPGCGKSSIIQHIARKNKHILLTMSCNNINTFDDDLNDIVKKAMDHKKAHEEAIILIKNIHQIFERKYESISRKSEMIVRKLVEHLRILAGVRVPVVATTCSPEDVDLVVRKPGCFSQELEVPIMTENDRALLISLLANMFSQPIMLDTAGQVARWTPGYVLGDLIGIFRQLRSLRNEASMSELEKFKKAVSLTMPTVLRGSRHLVSNQKTDFNDIGGLENIKKILRMNVTWQLRHPEAFIRLGIPPTRGILLYGPPGCAKTSLVKALACESSATFLAVSAADLYSPYVGESEKRLSKLFRQARVGAPSIVFIDEIDALVGNKSGDREHGVQERILATLLLEMDGVGVITQVNDTQTKMAEGQENSKKVATAKKQTSNQRIVVIGATNRPELLDDALKRPGRFDKLIHVPLPDKEERLTILKKVTSRMPLDEDVDLDKIANLTENYSGAELRNICNESALLALTRRGMQVERITMSDLIL